MMLSSEDHYILSEQSSHQSRLPSSNTRVRELNKESNKMAQQENISTTANTSAQEVEKVWPVFNNNVACFPETITSFSTPTLSVENCPAFVPHTMKNTVESGKAEIKVNVHLCPNHCPICGKRESREPTLIPLYSPATRVPRMSSPVIVSTPPPRPKVQHNVWRSLIGEDWCGFVVVDAFRACKRCLANCVQRKTKRFAARHCQGIVRCVNRIFGKTYPGRVYRVPDPGAALQSSVISEPSSVAAGPSSNTVKPPPITVKSLHSDKSSSSSGGTIYYSMESLTSSMQPSSSSAVPNNSQYEEEEALIKVEQVSPNNYPPPLRPATDKFNSESLAKEEVEQPLVASDCCSTDSDRERDTKEIKESKIKDSNQQVGNEEELPNNCQEDKEASNTCDKGSSPYLVSNKMYSVLQISRVVVVKREDTRSPTMLTVAYKGWWQTPKVHLRLALDPVRGAGRCELQQRFSRGRGPMLRVKGPTRKLVARLYAGQSLRTQAEITLGDLLSRTAQGVTQVPFHVKEGGKIEEAFIEVEQISPNPTPLPPQPPLLPMTFRFLSQDVPPGQIVLPPARDPTPHRLKQMVDEMYGRATDKTDWTKPFRFDSESRAKEEVTQPMDASEGNNTDSKETHTTESKIDNGNQDGKVENNEKINNSQEESFKEVDQTNLNSPPLLPLRFRFLSQDVQPGQIVLPPAREPTPHRLKQMVDEIYGRATDKTDWTKPFRFDSEEVTQPMDASEINNGNQDGKEENKEITSHSGDREASNTSEEVQEDQTTDRESEERPAADVGVVRRVTRTLMTAACVTVTVVAVLVASDALLPDHLLQD